MVAVPMGQYRILPFMVATQHKVGAAPCRSRGQWGVRRPRQAPHQWLLLVQQLLLLMRHTDDDRSLIWPCIIPRNLRIITMQLHHHRIPGEPALLRLGVDMDVLLPVQAMGNRGELE
jgi:hypothetical protein